MTKVLQILCFIIINSACSNEFSCDSDFIEITKINKNQFDNLNLSDYVFEYEEGGERHTEKNYYFKPAKKFARDNFIELFLYTDYDNYKDGEAKLMFALIKYYDCMNGVNKPLIEYK